MKVNVAEERYHFSRNMKDIDYDILNYNITQDKDNIQLLTDNDINNITEKLIKIIQHHYNNIAPQVKIKSTSINKNKLSKDTKL